MKTYEISSSMYLCGTYQGETKEDALDAMAKQMGYKDFSDSCAQTGADLDEAINELAVVEVSK